MRELRTSGSVGARRGDSPGYPTGDGDGECARKSLVEEEGM
jgi:hypothetical protein